MFLLATEIHLSTPQQLARLVSAASHVYSRRPWITHFCPPRFLKAEDKARMCTHRSRPRTRLHHLHLLHLSFLWESNNELSVAQLCHPHNDSLWSADAKARSMGRVCASAASEDVYTAWDQRGRRSLYGLLASVSHPVARCTVDYQVGY